MVDDEPLPLLDSVMRLIMSSDENDLKEAFHKLHRLRHIIARDNKVLAYIAFKAGYARPVHPGDVDNAFDRWWESRNG